MRTISTSTLVFLSELNDNNNRDWFNKHKLRYEEAKMEFEQFIDALIQSIATFDPEVAHQTAKNCVFRIYRDVRFSDDKSPYKTNFGAHITGASSKKEIHARAGYYIHLEPGQSFLAGGAYLPKGDWLNRIRENIDRHAGELKKIINGDEFKQYFGELNGDKLKTAPRGYTVDHPEIELLRLKSFMAVHNLSDKQLLQTDFLDHCTTVFKALYPLDQFLNKAAAKPV